MGRLKVTFKPNTAFDHIQRRMCQLGLLMGSQLVFSTSCDGRVVEEANVNVPDEHVMRYTRNIRMIPQVAEVKRA